MPKERAEGDSRAEGHTRAKDDARAVDREKGLRIRLFDADRTDEALSLGEALNAQVSGRQILWIDVEGELQAESLRAMVERFGFDEATERVLAEPSRKPHIQLHGKHFHLCVAAEPDAERPEDIRWVDIVAGPNVVVTTHPQAMEFVEATDECHSGSSSASS